MAKHTLKLLADSYEQRQPNESGRITRDSDTRSYSKGEVFEAHSQEEYDRLTAAGAALDPKAAQEAEAEDLRRRQAQLEAESERLAAELESVEGQADRVESGKPAEGDALEDLSVDELKDRAKAANIEGYSSMRKAELLDALRDDQQG